METLKSFYFNMNNCLRKQKILAFRGNCCNCLVVYFEGGFSSPKTMNLFTRFSKVLLTKQTIKIFYISMFLSDFLLTFKCTFLNRYSIYQSFQGSFEKAVRKSRQLSQPELHQPLSLSNRGPLCEQVQPGSRTEDRVHQEEAGGRRDEAHGGGTFPNRGQVAGQRAAQEARLEHFEVQVSETYIYLFNRYTTYSNNLYFKGRFLLLTHSFSCPV